MGADIYSKRLNCGNNPLSFSPKIRNLAPEFLINGNKIQLAQSCYSSLTCSNFKGEESALLMVDDACGGNAVPPYYLLINLKTLSKKQISYAAAKNAKLIKD